jgi:hypothetical protein
MATTLQPPGKVPAPARLVAAVQAAGDGRDRQLFLAGQCLPAKLAIGAVGMPTTGVGIGQQIESGVLDRTAAMTALLMG